MTLLAKKKKKTAYCCACDELISDYSRKCVMCARRIHSDSKHNCYYVRTELLSGRSYSQYVPLLPDPVGKWDAADMAARDVGDEHVYCADCVIADW